MEQEGDVAQDADSSAVEDVMASLEAGADPQRAAQEKRYLKSDIAHLGVSVPKTRRVATDLARRHPDWGRSRMLEIVEELWAEPVHERRMVAVELLAINATRLEADDLDLVERMIRGSRTWALVDGLAVNVAGTLVERFPGLAATLDRWAGADDFWVRRAALLAMLKPLRAGQGDFGRFARYADGMLEERQFFIQKAIGWVLRETGKRRPGLVTEWLRPRAARASGVTLREAVKYLPDADRRAILDARE